MLNEKSKYFNPILGCGNLWREFELHRGSLVTLCPHGIKQVVKINFSLNRWSFSTEAFDICFAAHRKTAEGLEEYVPKRRINCQIVKEEGEMECLKAGTCKYSLL